MRVNGYVYVILLLLLVTQHGYAALISPVDTPILLKTVHISTFQYKNQLSVNKEQQIDSLQLLFGLNQNLATILQSNSQLFIKNYGNGQLSTVSMRGGNAHHTPILWNGFNLQNPMLGQTDLSQIPVFFLSGIHVNYGSNAALFGSGAVGGTVSLQTKPILKDGFGGKLLFGNSSFGINTQALQLNFKNNKIAVVQQLYKNGGLNNFNYHNYAIKGNPVLQAVNASFETWAWLSQVAINISNNQTFALNTWVQDNTRELPPTIGSSNTYAKQLDNTKRLTAEYNWYNNNYRLQVRSGLFDDYINYSSSLIAPSISKSQTFTNFIDQYIDTKKGQLHVGLMHQYSAARAEGYTFASQNRVAIFGSYQWQWLNSKLVQQIQLRQELANGKPVPFVPSYAITFNANKYIKLQGNIAKTYRLPTFNDMYWAGLGNPNLLPESGICSEFTTYVNYKNISASVAAYNKQLNNWIIWLPNAIGLFTPQNIASVWSRGAEFNWNLHEGFGKYKFALSGLHDFNLATNKTVSGSIVNSLNKQLIYTPRLKHQFSLLASIKQFNASITHNYVGLRFTSSDNTSWLPAYQTTNIGAGYHVKALKGNFTLNATLNNIFNTNYQVILARAMPLRNYSINLLYQF